MTYYSTTLLPPSSLPHSTINAMISTICDRCIKEQEDESIPPHIRQQLFEFTLSIVEFWYEEANDLGLER